MTTKTRALSAVKWTAFSMFGKAAFAFLQLVILARLLEPREFGVIAITMTVVNTARIISDLGISSALIHFEDVTEEELSSLFWLNVLSGIALTLALLLFSYPIALFYGEPELFTLIGLSSLHFVIWAVGQQFRVLSEKRLDFKVLSWIEVGSFAAGVAVAIYLAHLDFGPICVVWGFLTTALTNSAATWLLLSRGWLPLMKMNLRSISRFLKFGVSALGISVANTLALQSDVAISGRMLGLGGLGAYYQPREFCLRIMFVINPIVTRVSFPVLAAARADRGRLQRVYLQALLLANSINFPIYGSMVLFSREYAEVVLGKQWIGSANLLALIALWSAIRSVGNPINSLLLATGDTRRALTSAILVCISLSVTCFLGSFYGFEGVVLAMIAFYIALMPLFWFFLARPNCGVRFWPYHRQIVVPALCATASVVAGWALVSILTIDIPIFRLAVGCAAIGLSYIAISFLFNRTWFDVMAQLIFNQIFKRKTSV